MTTATVPLADRLRGHRELLRWWVREEIKDRYYQTKLGPIWVVAQPLLMTLVFTIAFTVFAKIGSRGAPYPLFFIIGYVAWTYFNFCANRGSVAILSNLRVIAHYPFPRELLVFSTLLSALVDVVVGAVLIGILMVFYSVPLRFSALGILPLFVIQLVLTLGVAFWLATLSALWRDLRALLPSALRAAFYLSPVIYPVTRVPESMRPEYLWNPMAALIVGYRDLLLSGRLEHAGSLAIAALTSLAVLISGYWFFKTNEWRFADLI